MLKKTSERGVDMSNEDEFFAEMHPQIAQVIGIAVMQLLVEKREPSREALIEMIQVLWQGDQVDLAVELALDVLMLREVYWPTYLAFDVAAALIADISFARLGLKSETSTWRALAKTAATAALRAFLPFK